MEKPRKRVDTCPPGSVPCDEWVGEYLDHGIMLEKRYYAEHNRKDLEGAAFDYQEALKLIPPIHDACRKDMHRRIEEALGIFSRGEAKFTYDPDQEKALRLYKLGDAFLTRFERTGTPKDLDKATSNLQKAAELATDAHPDKHAFLNRLAGAHFGHFNRSQKSGDLKNAISALQNSIKLTPDDHPDKQSRLALLKGWEKTWEGLTAKDAGVAKAAAIAAANAAADTAAARDNAITAAANAAIASKKATDADTKSTADAALAAANEAAADAASAATDATTAAKKATEAASKAGANAAAKAFADTAADTASKYAADASADADAAAKAAITAQDAVNGIRITISPPSAREMIAFMHKDIELTTEDRAYRSIMLGGMLQDEFHLHDKAADIDNAIVYYQKGVDHTPDHHSDKPSYLMLLGDALRSRFKRFGKLEDLDRATSVHQRAVDLIPEEDPSRLSCLNTLSEMKRLEDFDSAISSLEKSVNSLPSDHPDRVGRLITLGMAYRTRFERLGSLTDLNKAISVLQEADKLAADDLPNQLLCHYALGDALQVRFEHLGDPKNMQDAILKLQKAVNSSPDDHPCKSTYLNGLGRALLAQSETSGKIGDLNGAISKLDMAVKLTPAGHAKESHHLHDLGNALRIRFELDKNLEDLQESISNLQWAVEHAPDGHPDKPIHLSSLGVALMTPFELYGDHADLETAISLLQDADTLTLDSHTSKPSILSNLGKALQKRHERANKLEDLNTAISSLRKATDLAPENRPSNFSHLTDLAVGLQKRYELLGAPADLDSLISSLNKGIARLQTGKPVNAKYFNSLGKALQERYECRGDPDDLDGSISNLDNSITNTPNKNSYKAPRFSNLGSAHSTAFNKSNSLDDLNKSISAHEKAVKLMPHGHPHETHHFLDLGKMLGTREKISGGFGEAELAFSRAAKSASGNPKKRFEAALEWAKCCKESSKSPLEAYKCVIELLPQIAWVGLDVADQQARLAEIGDVVHDAVAAAIEEKDFKLALEWSEHGRSIVWQNQLSLRTPLDDLRLAHPDLAARFEKISQERKIPVNDGSLGSKEVTETTEEVAVKHLRLVREWDGIVKEIRSKPNFESFLKPKSISQLDPAAHDGPVVMFNIQENRCDALTLVSDGKDVTVDNTLLENLSKKNVEKLLKQFQDALSVGIHVRSPRGHRWGSSKTDAKADLTKILRTLWTDVVKPVIESLGEKAKTNARRRTKPTIDGLEYETEAAEDNEPPQIWWCPTGPLAFLPLHGAGLYGEDDDGKGASDFVISSYIPTLSSMLGQDNGYDDSFRLLTVAQPATPYATPIPKTVDEVGRVASFATGISLMELISGRATVRSVSSEMEVSDWVHLACHGEQVTGKSMECGLLLHDRKLTLTEIINLSLRPRADFAFLSACQTAAGDQTIAEESAHLASGMLFAGYRGVIATMWPINDEDGPQIAEDVYKRILKDGKPNRKEAARALHEAVKRLKETSNGDILSWVPFIHLGN